MEQVGLYVAICFVMYSSGLLDFSMTMGAGGHWVDTDLGWKPSLGAGFVRVELHVCLRGQSKDSCVVGRTRGDLVAMIRS